MIPLKNDMKSQLPRDGNKSSGSNLWQNAKGTHSRITQPPVVSRGESSAASSQEMDETLLVGSDGTVHQESSEKTQKQKGIKDLSLKRAMYNAQLYSKGILQPGEEAKWSKEDTTVD